MAAGSFEWSSAILLFIIGLNFGSFFNVCIYRLPREESIVWPGSHCPQCGKRIAWYDNIPILSFLFLLGKCRHCKNKISLRYPAVEIITGLLWVFCWLIFGWSIGFWVSLLFFSLLLIITVTDFETGLIPDLVTFFGIGAGLVLGFLFPSLHGQSVMLAGLRETIMGAFLGGALIYSAGFLGKLAFKKEAMGEGDVKLMLMAGCFLGVQNITLTFFLAPFLALPFALYIRLVKKEETVPYGPFLAGAAAVCFLLGNNIWQYLFPF